MGIVNNALSGASGQSSGYNLTNSLRFRSSASAYLNRTFTQSGDTQKFTQSVWCKRGTLGAYQTIGYTVFTGTYNGQMRFNSNDTLDIYVYYDGSSYTGQLSTTQVFRDPSAWYHFVLAVDTTQATASNRIKFYVNGVQVTAFGTANYPNQNQALVWNASGNTGYFINAQQGNQNFFDGYLAELNYIDGQALTPSSFGQTSATTGVWIPKKYTGTYGTNGFYLKFTDKTSTSTLGTDFSGNSNTWTVNNISLTAGTTYDSMTDVPTLTSATAANYCTGNWLNQTDLDILREGNLFWRVDNTRAVTGTLSMTTGKWYWEATISAIQNYIEIGIVGTNARFSGPNNFVPGSLSTGYGYRSDATKINNNTTASYGATYAANDVIGVAFDADAGTLTFYKNNSSQGTAYSSIPSNFYVAYDYGGPAGGQTGAYFNFGQRPFTYTPPSGFLALNTFNLPTPTIGATASTTANKYFDATTYTGTGANQSITNSGSMQPDLLWIKIRNTTGFHVLGDAVRGAGSGSGGLAILSSNSTNVEASANLSSFIVSLNSNGFTVGNQASTTYFTNTNGNSFVGWQWRASGSTASNTDGSITSTVSANTTAGFSIVGFNSGAAGDRTVGHGLGVTPSVVIMKSRQDADYNWAIYHSSVCDTTSKFLPFTTSGLVTYATVWGAALPTSTVFGITSGNGNGGIFNNTNCIAYCFAPVAGYSSFGKYIGNGSTDGTFVFTGFRPRFVMFKRTDAVEQWAIRDTARDTYNASELELFPNLSNAEEDNNLGIDLISNGFKIRNSANRYNASSGTYIYMAFAESPLKFSNAR